MTWELVEVTEDIPWTGDNSGIFTFIHRQVTTETHKEYSGETVRVRVDIMELETDGPLVSFIGTDANWVRKAVIAWIFRNRGLSVSLQHASYIGYEIHKAFVTPDYVQD